MKIIGISGGTGAGKSLVCAELKKRGAAIIDADEISRRVSRSDGCAYAELVEFFGSGILQDSGEIDRRELGRIVFSDPEKLAELNRITHKHIFAEMKREIDGCTAQIAVFDVPLLFQSDFPFDCDLTVAVVAQPEVRLSRIMARDGISRDAAEARMRNQMPDEEYARLADMCADNSKGVEEIPKIVDMIIKEVTK